MSTTTTESSSSFSTSSTSWWQRAIVKRTVSFVEMDLQHVMEQSPFLQQQIPSCGNHIALFHRSEIVTGKLLGKGGFSQVHEITGFCLNDEVSRRLSPEQQEIRQYYVQNVRNDAGQCRYAIKHLQQRLLDNAKDFQYAASDLAVEAAYLSAIDHPHILPVRGLPLDGLQAFGDGRHDGYFIISDRLHDTLDQRVHDWRTNNSQDASVYKKAEYALELASALDYLHDRRIVFRDLKPQNIGFDLNDRLVLFDFGLCREIPHGSDDEVFEMSGVGTRRYMAVEIINDSYYNHKVDVYGWAMVFWEMLSLGKPFPAYSVQDHKKWVCQGGERPTIQPCWPMIVQTILQSAWSQNILQRWNMKQVRRQLSWYLESTKMVLETPDSPVCVQDVFSEDDTSISQQQHVPIHIELPKELLLQDSSVSMASEASTIYSLLDNSLLGRYTIHSEDGIEVIASNQLLRPCSTM